MKTSQCRRESNAIALVVVPEMVYIENDRLMLDLNLMEMRYVCPKHKAIAVVLCTKLTQIEMNHFDVRFKSDENEITVAKN